MSSGPGKRFPLTLSDLEKDSARTGGGVSRKVGQAAAPQRKSPLPASYAPYAPSGPTNGHAARVPLRPSAVAAANAVGVPAGRLPMSAKATLVPQLTLTSARVRERMVERVQASGVSHPGVLAALRDIPRHLFVDAALAPQAYEEAALPIGHHQTISKPGVVARMIEIAMNGRPSLARVLEVGTGCGYQAAVLSRVADEVFSIERIKPLHERAKRNLRPLRAPNIRLHYGDGRVGLASSAPFDAIVVAAAGLDVPPALTAQLAIGGRLIAPVGGDSQVLTLVERIAANQWRETVLDRVFFVPLKSGVI